MARARVLVVDDDRAMTRAVRRALSHEYVVTEVNAPEQALAELDRDPPEVAILDISMPGMSGFVLMDRLRERRADLDVVFMTGSVDADSIHMIEAIRKGAFYYIQKPFQSELLVALVGRCLALRRARRELERRTAIQERQLRAARDFQANMIPGPNARWDPLVIHGYFAPCHEVGGDLYDYQPVEGPTRYIAAMLADIAGKGAGAAMLTSALRYAFRTAAADDFIPHVVMHRMRATIPPMDTHHYATAACLRIHPGARVIDYVNAGHLSMIVRRADGTVEEYESTGLPVSPLVQERPWGQVQIPFQPGDTLLLYSDGVVECQNDRREMFEAPRLLEIVRSTNLAHSSLVDAVAAALAAFRGAEPPADDVTMLEIQYQR